MRPIEQILKEAEDRGATELLLTAGVVPAIRVKSSIEYIDDPIVTQLELVNLLQGITTPLQFDKYNAECMISFSYSVKNQGRYFVTAFLQRGSLSMTFLFMHSKLILQDLESIPHQIDTIANTKSGLIVITGNHRSGKSVLANAIIDKINSTRSCNIVTLENPIRFLNKNKCSLITQREFGTDFHDTKNTLKMISHNPPDVLLVDAVSEYNIFMDLAYLASLGTLVIVVTNFGNMQQCIENIIYDTKDEQKQQMEWYLSKVLKYIIYKQNIIDTNNESHYLYDIIHFRKDIRKKILKGNLSTLRLEILRTSQSSLSFNKQLDRLYEDNIIDQETYDEYFIE